MPVGRLTWRLVGKLAAGKLGAGWSEQVWRQAPVGKLPCPSARPVVAVPPNKWFAGLLWGSCGEAGSGPVGRLTWRLVGKLGAGKLGAG